MIRRTALAILFTAASLASALAIDGLQYVNARYGFQIELPAGFSAVREADNGDGGKSHSADRTSELSLWGTNLLVESLASDVGSRIDSAAGEDWTITYKKVARRWASWSGEREGRIFYARAISLCHDDEVAYFQLEYPAEAKDDFDPVVQRLVKNFKATSCDN